MARTAGSVLANSATCTLEPGKPRKAQAEGLRLRRPTNPADVETVHSGSIEMVTTQNLSPPATYQLLFTGGLGMVAHEKVRS